MRTGFPGIIALLLVVAVILYFFVEPGTARETTEEIRQSVREGVRDTKDRIDYGVAAAKKDVETIKSDLREGGYNDRKK